MPTRAALRLSLACVLLSGLVLIGCILTRSFGELAARVALALLALWVFGLTAIHGIEASDANVSLARPTGLVAQLTAAIGLTISLVLIGLWDKAPHLSAGFGRFFVSLTVLSLCAGHGGYLLSRTRVDDSEWTRRAVWIAYDAFAAIAAGVVLFVGVDRDVPRSTAELLWRLLAVALIVGVGGSITAPILRRLAVRPA